jgi:hypothetical protein
MNILLVEDDAMLAAAIRERVPRCPSASPAWMPAPTTTW